ncbi:MAG TPA: formylglycine-generating enzyme family protein [Pirellulaceae bacterium]|nr:formylglycine-generating enzyme family protein [Pirellulaceae bacterium]
MKFRLIPPGEFMMGTRAEDLPPLLQAAGDDQRGLELARSEAPLHKVVLTKPFYLTTTEVTQRQYQAVMSENPSYFGPDGEGRPIVASEDLGSLPVDSVSWFDVAALCMKLSGDERVSACYARSEGTTKVIQGTGYRMPTEAEWEFACRAGTTSQYWTGDDDESFCLAAWVKPNSSDRPHPVGRLRANPFGLFDMHGNVVEWVVDRWDSNCYADAPESGDVDPFRGYGSEANATIRGGHFGSVPIVARAAGRANADRANRSGSIGCRLAISVEGVKELLARRKQSDRVTNGKDSANGKDHEAKSAK